ncbi:hypothetical protein BB561_004855 [Smittium simulii]|uniref:Peptide hydrolase n=1 Tax=Smittium simulii TaxID=133385 RepID=A0A2T9YDV2_9FUNG|nr:hypothetical protein BB561_004855 [Smittium simulii]
MHNQAQNLYSYKEHALKHEDIHVAKKEIVKSKFKTKFYGLVLGLVSFLLLKICIIDRVSRRELLSIDHTHIKTNNIFRHLDNFYNIAKKHNNSRSTTNGHPDVAKYVISALKKYSFCDIKTQTFKVPIWSALGPPTLELSSNNGNISFIENTDFGYHRYGGSSAAIYNKQVLHLAHGGCLITDNIGVSGKIALIEPSSNCTLFEAAFALEQAGAIGVLISTSRNAVKPSIARIRIVDWKENDPLMTIPVFSVTYSTFQSIKNTPDAKFTMIAQSEIRVVETFNTFCESRHGCRNNTIVVGAHLDSVAFGPGINDNGSGSASVLEIALKMAKFNYKPRNKIVFAWWGSEEDGLLGSRHFVRDLTLKSKKNLNISPHDLRSNSLDVKLNQIAMNLNFDMLASPNFIPFIHNGTDAPSSAQCGSIRIQKSFEQYFKLVKRNYKITDMLGGSDFLPFILNGIPAGGLLTGASEIKTEQERLEFGGMANAALDPCYHKYCDTTSNINKDALQLMSRGAAYSILKFSGSKNLRSELAKC